MAQPYSQDVPGPAGYEHHDQHCLPLGGREGLSPAQAHATAVIPGLRGLAGPSAPGTLGIDVFTFLL